MTEEFRGEFDEQENIDSGDDNTDGSDDNYSDDEE